MAGEGAFLVTLAPPFLPPTPPAKKLNWGAWEEKSERRLSGAQPFKFTITWQLATEKNCFSPTRTCFFWLPLRWATQDHLTGPQARSPAHPALCSLLHTREGERQIKAAPSSTAPQIKSEVPPSER